jgi:hypothetical protein
MVGAIGFFSGGTKNFLWWGIENITVNNFFLRCCLIYYYNKTHKKKSFFLNLQLFKRNRK